MFKKITAFFLCFTLAVSVTVGAKPAYGIASDDDTGYRLLSQIGVLDNDDLKKLGHDVLVTRAEFVRKLAKCAALNTDTNGDSSVFSDVVPSMDCYGAVTAAYNAGYISGNDGRFNPNDSITVTDASVIAVRALGYGSYCNNNGGYPSGYVRQINKLDITDGVDGVFNSFLTADDMPRLLLNMMTAPVLDEVSYKNGKADYSNDANRTLLGMYYDIYEAYGIVTSNSVTALNYGDGHLDGYIVVDNVRYKVTEAVQNEYLGCNVRLFYKQEKNAPSGTVVYMCEYDNDMLRIEASDIVKAEKDGITYTDGSKQKKIKVGLNTKYIYNGKSLNVNDDYLKCINDMTSGYITAIDNSGASHYDVISIWAYSNIIYANYNADNETVYDYMSKPNNIELKDKDYVLLDSDGNEKSFSDLTKYDILSVGQSLDGDYIKMIVSYLRVTGTLDSFVKSGADRPDKVTINGKEYEVSAFAKNSDSFKLVVGMQGTFYLSYDGKVVYFNETDNSNLKSGMMLGLLNGSGVDSNSIKAYILDSNGNKAEYDFAKNVVLDGKSVAPKDLYTTLLNGELRLTPRVICYLTDETGRVTYVDTDILGPDETLNSLHKIRSKDEEQLNYKSGNRNFGIKFWPNGTPLYFGAPAEYGDVIDYSQFATTTLRNDHKSPIELYAIGENPVAYDICVAFGNYSETDANIERGQGMSVVKNVSIASTDDGTMYKLSLYDGSSVVEFYVDPSKSNRISEFTPGSIIRYGLTPRGYIGYWEILYDSVTKTFPKADANGYYSTGNKDPFIPDGDEFSFGWVYDVTDSYYVRISASPETINEDTPYAYPLKGGAYLIKETGGNYDVIKISGDDIKDYVHFGYGGYRAAAFVSYGDVSEYRYYLFIE